MVRLLSAKKAMFQVLIGTFLMCATSIAMSQDNATEGERETGFHNVELLSSPITLMPGSVHALPLYDGWHQVKRLVITAIGIGSDATFEVETNGEVRGTVHVPRQDPQYVVTIGEAANAIIFRHIAGASVRISSIQALMSIDAIDPNDGSGSIGDEGQVQAAQISHHAIDLCRDLHSHTSADDWENYALPIKIAAGRAYAYATASGDLSGRVRQSLVALLAQIGLADSYIERAMRDDDTFDLAVSLLGVKNRLADLLD